MPARFVSVSLQPVGETIGASRMGMGEPGLPTEFRWGKKTIRVASVVQTWRETGPCRNGSRERYLQKHWYEIETDEGERMKIYFERQPKRRSKARWWLYSVQG